MQVGVLSLVDYLFVKSSFKCSCAERFGQISPRYSNFFNSVFVGFMSWNSKNKYLELMKQ